MRPVQASASLRDVTVVFDDRPVLRDVTIDFAPGLTLIRGPNGAGKTTLLRAIAGLVPLARGARAIAADPLFIGQRTMLLRALSARENLIFYRRFRGLSADGVEAALAAWGISARDRDRPVEQLSAGERRRASLARIRTEPLAIMLLDEPFTELDDAASSEVRTAIGAARDDGRTVIVATHAHPELDALAGATVGLREGRVIVE